MPRVLIVFASIDGQTARIAERMALTLREAGLEALVHDVDSPEPPEVAGHAAVIVGGGIRYGRHSAALEQWVRSHLAELARRPGAFFSVCLSAGGPGARPATADGYRADFMRRTGWYPATQASFAGALPYRRYNPFVRLMMRIIVGVAGGDTDASRDYEYTDWDAVEIFAAAFAARVRGVPLPRPAVERVLEAR
ncbi:MAG TPA: menaquinone-dependent protoporphyrinogen IX dehydrogenase [Usitatibacter sp.]|nr:menaquinone-dependent protoporphyrinogen IX dehydrogenase [Usitatibacter sp.]